MVPSHSYVTQQHYYFGIIDSFWFLELTFLLFTMQILQQRTQKSREKNSEVISDKKSILCTCLLIALEFYFPFILIHYIPKCHLENENLLLKRTHTLSRSCLWCIVQIYSFYHFTIQYPTIFNCLGNFVQQEKTR